MEEGSEGDIEFSICQSETGVLLAHTSAGPFPLELLVIRITYGIPTQILLPPPKGII